jgi:hypothetical protein
MKAIIGASSRMLSAFRTAPAMATPKCASKASGVLAAMTATVSFLLIPRWRSALARRRQRA